MSILDIFADQVCAFSSVNLLVAGKSTTDQFDDLEAETDLAEMDRLGFDL